MARGELGLYVAMDHDEDYARLLLKKVSEVDPRPIRAACGSRVEMSFAIGTESDSEVRGQQSRIYDSPSKVVDEVEASFKREKGFVKTFAIEFDAPSELKAGSKEP